MDGCIVALGGRVVGQAQDVATTDAGETAGASNEEEAPRAHASDQVRIGAFAEAPGVARFGVAFDRRDDLNMVSRVIAEVIETFPQS